MNSITVAHRDAKTWSDKTALAGVKFLRWGLDLATWYRHDPAAHGVKAANGVKHPGTMTEKQYMIRSVPPDHRRAHRN